MKLGELRQRLIMIRLLRPCIRTSFPLSRPKSVSSILDQSVRSGHRGVVVTEQLLVLCGSGYISPKIRSFLDQYYQTGFFSLSGLNDV